MVRVLFSYFVILCLVLTACSDSIGFPEFGQIGHDGRVEMTLTIPSSVVSRTRSTVDEYDVSDLSVFAFKGEDNSEPVAQYVRIFSDPSQNSGSESLVKYDSDKIRISFRLNEDLSHESGLSLYFIANVPSGVSLSDIESLGELKVKATSLVVSDGRLIMSGQSSFSQIKTSSVSLIRNCAKVSVSDSDPMSSEASSIEYYPYAVFGSAGSSLFLNAVMKEAQGNPTKEFGFPEDLEDSSERFVHPTHNQENEQKFGGDCFIVVKAKYEGVDYFYRLDFYDRDEYLSLESNHWYQFIIKKVLGEGYPSPEEASKHPDARLMYEIHDHCPRSFNMASDGFRELGVTHRVDYNGQPNISQDDWSDEYVYIRFFSKNSSELPVAAQVRGMIGIEDDSWLELSDAEEVTDEAEHVDANYEDDDADVGRLFRCKLRFKSSAEIGTLENFLTVSWKGLSRTVPVMWRRGFNGAEVCSASLTMSYNGTVTTIEDYWKFLSSTDKPDDVNSSGGNLWGIQPQANNGNLRNQGFHFPVMYGEGGETGYATYSYEVVFNKGDVAYGDNFELEYKVTGDPYVEVKVTSKDPLTFSVTRNSSLTDDYQYATGTLKLKVTDKDTGHVDNYAFALYHTGFFHKDSQTHRMDDKDERNYYYYEVVPFMMGTQRRYMLDRNLGAKSAEMYVRDSNESNSKGNPAAAGGFYKVAWQQEGEYLDPVMFDSETDRVSPPGYAVPTQREWDCIRNSSSFHTEYAGEYFTAYYDTGNPEIGRVYFPKAMFYNNGVKGETRTGYYWTQSAATGTEKEEIGRWLKMLNILGNATSYSNGCVEVRSNTALAYGASVRCVNEVKDIAKVKRTSFNVSGATHVFLYSEENGVRIPTTTWPGHPIGNYATMKEGWFGFKYESSDVDPEDLCVIFNFVDKKGIIHTYSQNGLGNTEVTTDKKPADCLGWRVIGDTNHNLIPEKAIISGGQALAPAIDQQSRLGNWWRCGDDRVSIYDAINAEFKVYWPYSRNLTILDETGEEIFNSMTAAFSDKYGYYSFEFTEPDMNKFVSIGYNEASTRSRTVIGEGRLSEIFGVDIHNTKCIYLSDSSISKGVPEDLSVDHLKNNPVADGFKRIYMVNVKGWNPVRIWYWSDTHAYCQDRYGNWPGPEMLRVETGNSWLWYFDVEEGTQYVIFNTGTNGSETTQLTLSSDKDKWYTN